MLELSAWRNALEVPILEWSIQPPLQAARPIRLGEPWGFSDGTDGYNTHTQGAVRFETNLLVPPALAGFPVELELDFGGEGFLEIIGSGGTIFRGGLNPFHRAFVLLEQAAGLEPFQIKLEVVPKGLFGARNETPSLSRAHLVAPHLEIREFLTDLETLHQVAVALDTHEVVPHLLAAAEDVFEHLVWTSNATDYLSRLMHGTLGTPFERSILWSLPSLPALKPLESDWLLGIVAARGELAIHLEKIASLYPAQGNLALTGHAHIDLAWLWTISETRRKIQRTFGTVLELMKRYPDFTFNQSSAQAYAWLEQDDPAMFQEIVARVHEGRWEAIGGMWVEPDGQMLHGESWVRQILYGQSYFLEKFGRTSEAAWLPDTFGFNPQLPQLLRLGGMDKFFTTKLRWNETSLFPHDLFIWSGLDGSTVLAHCFWNKFDSYNALLDPKSILGTWQNFIGKANKAWLKHPNPPRSLLSFGYGDGGGGPSREHLEGYARLQNYPAMPKLEMTRVDDFFGILPTDLPVWHGEMYLELHRATLTTQAKIKKLHRALEHRLLESEICWSLAWLEGESYPTAQLERLWKTLLLHQFHDILPGSSIRQVVEDAEAALESALQETVDLQKAAPKNGQLRSALEQTQADLKEVSQTQVQVQALPGGSYILDSSSCQATISPSGWLTSFKDQYGTEFLAAPVVLSSQHDVPREWEAWDINPAQTMPLESRVEITKLESGVQVKHYWRDSIFTQDYHLESGRLVVKNHVLWQEKRVLIRVEFPLTLHIQQAYFENAFGAVQRQTYANTASQAAAFEVAAHRFVLLESANKNLALLNDCKYGFAINNNLLTMSLLRGSLYPDPMADFGEHTFSYALDFLADCNQADFVPLEQATRAGIEFNSPILAAAQHLFSSHLILSAVHKSQTDDALIVRFYESCGRTKIEKLDFTPFAPIQITQVDFLERQLEVLELTQGVVSLPVKPFEVITLKLYLGKQ